MALSKEKKESPPMQQEQPNNPLHAVTLEQIVNRLSGHYGWDELGRQIDIRCFQYQPSVKSSLKFLRRTPWARQKVEELYVTSVQAMKVEKAPTPTA